jgi:hypothetical protein
MAWVGDFGRPLKSRVWPQARQPRSADDLSSRRGKSWLHEIVAVIAKAMRSTHHASLGRVGFGGPANLVQDSIGASTLYDRHSPSFRYRGRTVLRPWRE